MHLNLPTKLHHQHLQTFLFSCFSVSQGMVAMPNNQHLEGKGRWISVSSRTVRALSYSKTLYPGGKKKTGSHSITSKPFFLFFKDYMYFANVYVY